MWPLRGLLAASILGACGALLQRRTGDVCQNDPDDISYARIATRTCLLNWALRGDVPPFQYQTGCWYLKVYNTDKMMSSTVYQHTDGRCVLGFSGFHGALAGYLRGAFELLYPTTTWPMCGNEMWAPFVRLLRHHTGLGNWSRMVDYLSGPQSSCQGELMVAAESMGGSMAQIMAACANSQQMHQVQDRKLPVPKIAGFYTFGAQAASRSPIQNPQRKDGCWKGKRVYNNNDLVGKSTGLVFGLKHPRMDVVELAVADGQPTYKAFSCHDQDIADEANRPKPPPLKTKEAFAGQLDPLGHQVTGYEDELAFFHKAGLGEDLGNDLLNLTSAQYANLRPSPLQLWWGQRP